MTLKLNSIVKKQVKTVRYDIIRNVYDGFDEL